MMTKDTGFSERTGQLTRKYHEYRGYWLPTEYPSHRAKDRHYPTTSAAPTRMDILPIQSTLDVTGPDAEKLLCEAVRGLDPRHLSVGQQAEAAMETSEGLHPGELQRLCADRFRWLSHGDTVLTEQWLSQRQLQTGLRAASVRNNTGDMHNIAVRGPHSHDTLRAAIWAHPSQPTIDELGVGRFMIGRVNKFDGNPVIVTRSDNEEFDISCCPNTMAHVQKVIYKAGQPYEIRRSEAGASEFTELHRRPQRPRSGEAGAIAEYWACRERAVILDLSPLRKFEVTGPDAEALLQYVLTRNVKKLKVGAVTYSSACYDHGGMVDDGTLLKLSNEHYRWVCGEEHFGHWLEEQRHVLGLQDCVVRSSTDEMHNVAVQGPLSRTILSKAVSIDAAAGQIPIEELGVFKFTAAEVGGVPVTVSRTGYTGELGFEVFCHPSDGTKVWDAIWEQGEPHDMRPMGLDALDMVRIEAGLIFAGYEFDDTTCPFEAGVGFTVPLKSKKDDFIGREALIRKKANPTHQLVGLELHSGEVAVHGDCVHLAGMRAQVGVVTSGMRSPVLGGKSIALVRMDTNCTAVGTPVEVGKLDGHQKRIAATVVAFPHYDPKKTRLRS